MAVTMAVFLPVRGHDFINLDDNLYLTENPHLRHGLTEEAVRWSLTANWAQPDPHSDYWRPLSFLSHALDVELFGMNPAGHHWMNVLFHAVNAVVLFELLRRMTGALWPSVFVAAIWAVHPLRVEAVAWATARKDVLSTSFWLLTTAAYLWYTRAPRPGRYLVMLLCFVLGLMCKPMLVTLPFVLLLLDYWPLGRLQTSWRRAVAEKLPLLALSLISSAITSAVQTPGETRATLDQVPLTMRLGNAVTAYAAYLRKTIWPDDLAVFYPYPASLPAWQVALAAGVLVAITALAVVHWRRCPYLLVGWLWYLGTLVPVIGLVQVGSQSMADRFTYVPMVGVLIMAAWAWPVRPVWIGVGGGVLLACAVLARQQLGHWQNSETLFRHALAVTTDNWPAHHNLGETLEAQGHDAESADHYRATLRLQPDYAEAHFNLANVLSRTGPPREAVTHYQAALRLRPDYPKAHVNLGNLYLSAGQRDAAIRHYRAALVLQPAMAEAHNNLGLALAARGDFAAAIRHYEAALRIWPDSDGVRANLAEAQRKSREGVAR